MKKIYIATLLIMGVFTNGFTQKDIQAKLQHQFESVQDGGTINIEAGFFELNQTLLLKDKKNVTIKGAGAEQTFLSFKKLKKRSVGIKIMGAEKIKLEGLTVQNTSGGAVQIQNVSTITCSDMHLKWTGKPKKSNGAYGIFIDACTNVMINDHEIIGASNAGIYVNQSDKITIRLGNIHQNAAGVKIENTMNAEIYKNTIHDNRNGLVILDSPNANQKTGGFTRVYNNRIINNNHKKFTSKKSQTHNCPRGTGILIVASNDIELFSNEIEAHQSFGLMITSYFFTEKENNNSNFDPYSYRISVHDNQFKRKVQPFAFRGKMKSKLVKKFNQDLPDIALDGVFKPEYMNEHGWLIDGYRICIHDNGDAQLVNFDAAHDFTNIDTKPYPFRCELTPFRGLINEAFDKKIYETNEIKQ